MKNLIPPVIAIFLAIGTIIAILLSIGTASYVTNKECYKLCTENGFLSGRGVENQLYRGVYHCICAAQHDQVEQFYKKPYKLNAEEK